MLLLFLKKKVDSLPNKSAYMDTNSPHTPPTEPKMLKNFQWIRLQYKNKLIIPMKKFEWLKVDRVYKR